jgi:hypothetical protein
MPREKGLSSQLSEKLAVVVSLNYRVEFGSNPSWAT